MLAGRSYWLKHTSVWGFNNPAPFLPMALWSQASVKARARPAPDGRERAPVGRQEKLPDPCLWVVHTGRVRSRINGLSKRNARRAAAGARLPGAGGQSHFTHSVAAVSSDFSFLTLKSSAVMR